MARRIARPARNGRVIGDGRTRWTSARGAMTAIFPPAADCSGTGTLAGSSVTTRGCSTSGVALIRPRQAITVAATVAPAPKAARNLRPQRRGRATAPAAGKC